METNRYLASLYLVANRLRAGLSRLGHFSESTPSPRRTRCHRIATAGRWSTFLLLSLFGLGLSLPVSAQAPEGITVAGGHGAGSEANQLNFPFGVFGDGAGNIYVSDDHNNRVQKWAPGVSEGMTVAGGNGTGGASNQLNAPNGLFVDGAGNIYIADSRNHRIQKWVPGAIVGITVAGGNDRGNGANQFSFPSGVYVDGAGNIYVADLNNYRIQKWAPGASEGITVAGGHGRGSGANQLDDAYSMYVDGAGNLYVADSNNNRIQKWAPGANAGITVAGGNGEGSEANQFYLPFSVFVDAVGSIYVADYGNHRIQKWAPGASAGTTVAGGNGAGLGANQLNFPISVYVDGTGRIYVADYDNHRIQRFPALPTVSELSASPNSVCAGQPVTFTARVGNVTGNYAYTLTNGSSTSIAGSTSSTAFSQSLTAAGWGSQSFSLIVASNGQLATATTSLTVTALSPDYQPLVDLYNATNGANWTNNTGWLSSCDPCRGSNGSPWQGVGCSTSGRVVELLLDANNLVGTIPASLSGANDLERIILRSNQLSGSIPASLSALTKLSYFDVNGNQLTGSIPDGLGTLTKLTTFNLGSNKLSGSIPASLGNLTQLNELYLGDNQFTGSIPASLGSLTQLKYLDLPFNQLTGSIPAELGNLTQLVTLEAESNQLSGCFPASLSVLCGIQYIDFSSNPDLPGGGDFAAFCQGAATASASTSTPTVQLGQSIQLSASGGSFYRWSGPDNFASNEANPSFVATSLAQSGVYSVTVSNGRCDNNPISTVSVSVVDPLPTISGFSASPGVVCEGSLVSFTATVGNVTGTYNYTLTNGSSSSVAGSSASAAFRENLTGVGSGTQTFTLFVSSNSQSASTTTNVTVNSLPNADFSGLAGSYCANAGAATLTPATTGGIFSGPGISGTTFTPAQAGTGGTVSYSVTVNGCTSTSTQSVTVSALPTNASLTSGTLSCAITSLTLTASATGASAFSLSNGQTNNTGQFVINQPGSYTVTIANASGCRAMAIATVSSNTIAPNASLSNTGPIADNNQTVTLTAGGEGTYAFSAGAAQQGSGNTATVITPGPYSVTVTGTNGCTATASTTVTGAQNPATICRNGTAVIKVVAIGTAVKYEWYKNTLNSPRMAEITNLQRGTATSSLTLTNQQVTASYYVRVTDATGSAVVYGPFKVTVNMGCITALGRLAAEAVELKVTLLGNPLIGEQLRATVKGAFGKALSMQLLDLRGHSVRQQTWQQAEADQPIEWNLGGQASGVYLLQAITPADDFTPTQRHSLKVIKP